MTIKKIKEDMVEMEK